MGINNRQPRVSIVLPVYNGERYLKQAIDSIIAQTFQAWELIIVNDCSTDTTDAIIANFTQVDERIRVHNNTENLKLPRSLNVGFELARGEYYTWTSDDNILMPNMLERLVTELDSDKECGLVYSNERIIDESGNIVEDSVYDDRNINRSLSGYGASFLYRADVAERVGAYDPGLFLAEDYDYWLRMYVETRVKYVPEVLYLYRCHSGNLTATRTEQISRQTLRTLWKNFWPYIDKSESFKDRQRLFDYVYRYCDHETKKVYCRTILELCLWMVKNQIRRLFSR